MARMWSKSTTQIVKDLLMNIDMRHVAILIVLLVAVPLEVYAQSEGTIKVRFDANNLPSDQTFLPKFLEHITGAALQQRSADEQVSYVGTNLLLKDTVSNTAAQYLKMFVTVRNDIRQRKADYIRNNICQLDEVRPSGMNFLSQLDLADDNNDELGADALSTIRLAMSPKDFDAFLKWMNTTKQTSTILRINHKVAYANQDLDMVSQGYCGRFDSNNASK